MSDMKKCVMIGCGGIGQYHLSHLVEFKDIELAGFCDLIPERAADFVQKAGSGKAFTNYVEMYDEIKPDMAFICVPPYAHGDIEFDAIKRGIHFFVEKPVALDLELAARIRDAVVANNIITAVGFQCRYSNLVDINKQFIADNDIYYIDCVRVGGIPEIPWWSDRKQSGGQLVEQTIHQLDIIRYVYGEPDTVFSMGANGLIKEPQLQTEDTSSTIVRFQSGVVATISTGCYATSGAAFDSKVTFSGRDCRADLYILDNFTVYGDAAVTSNSFVTQGDGTFSRDGASVVKYKEEGDAGVLCDRTFVDAVISGDGSAIRSPYSDAMKSVAFGLAANESMDTGKAVKVRL